MITIQNLLMTGQPGWETTAPGSGTTYSPIIDGEAAKEHQLFFTVEGLTGNPDAASLNLLFEAVQQTTGAAGGTAYVTDNNPIYQDIGDTGLIVPAKAYASPLVDQSLVAQKSFIWTIAGGLRFRLGLLQAFTGGASPAFKLSASLVSHY